MSAEGAGVGVGGGPAVPFSLAAEVRDGGLRVPVVSGGQRGSLFRPILSVTAGRRGATQANGGAGGGGGGINGAAGELPALPLTLRLSIPQLDPAG